jgi:hypothetical protein
MFHDFHKGELSLCRLNLDVLTLIPKIDNADSIKFFRPISLINCGFKIEASPHQGRLKSVALSVPGG